MRIIITTIVVIISHISAVYAYQSECAHTERQPDRPVRKPYFNSNFRPASWLSPCRLQLSQSIIVRLAIRSSTKQRLDFNREPFIETPGGRDSISKTSYMAV